MRAFEFAPASSLSEVSELLTSDGQSARVIAGGTDLLGEIKEGVVGPRRLVSLQEIADLRSVRVYMDGVLIGAMATIADVGAHTLIQSSYSALAQACDSVATPQIRNVGTIGGNLCQRPRCWYYRSPLFDCRKKGGEHCFALEGANKFHAIFGSKVCPAVHPSDTAVALTALDARVLLVSSDGARMLPIEDFFVDPDRDVTTENVLQEGEILAEVVIPPASPRSRSVYLKAKERQAMDFALASVALAVDVANGTVSEARLVLGGVAPVPYRVHGVEDALAGMRTDEIDAAQVGRIAAEGAMPLSDNGYKVRLVSGLVARAVRTLLTGEEREGASQ